MRGERGQTAAEYLGVLLVVATLIGAVATTNVGASIRHGLSEKVCAIASGGGGSCASPAPRTRAVTPDGRRVLARAASRRPRPPVRSEGARRVAAANKAATKAILAALIHP